MLLLLLDVLILMFTPPSFRYNDLIYPRCDTLMILLISCILMPFSYICVCVLTEFLVLFIEDYNAAKFEI